MKNIIDAIIMKNSDIFLNYILETQINKWEILYNLIYMDWIEGLRIFIEHGGDINLKTKDDFFTLPDMNIPLFTIGGQNGLFISNNDETNKFLIDHGIEIVIDNNDNSHAEYKKNRNDLNFIINNLHKIKERCNIIKNCSKINNLIFESAKIYFNEYKFDGDLKKYINFDEIVNHNVMNVNSMHNKSYSVVCNDKLLNIVYTINEKFFASKITCFYLNYDCKNDKTLDKHVDDSKITIILCLENTSDCKIIYNDGEEECIQKENHIYIHKGNIPHYVTEQTKGVKKNIVLWLN